VGRPQVVEARLDHPLMSGEGRSFAHLGTAVSFKHEPADNGDALLLFEERDERDHPHLAT
jgi:hypothetical protein